LREDSDASGIVESDKKYWNSENQYRALFLRFESGFMDEVNGRVWGSWKRVGRG
jgi:hypothetical protein